MPRVRLRAALALARSVAAFHPAGAVCGGALYPENVVLASSVGKERYAATLLNLKDVVMFKGITRRRGGERETTWGIFALCR